MKQKGYIILALVLYGITATVAANPITTIVCPILTDIIAAFTTIAGTLVILMFLYGGLKYIFSADDPGGRKQGKMTCIHAVIGGVIVVLATNIVGLLAMASC